MAPKRKPSSGALESSLHQLQGSTSSKRRLVLDDADSEATTHSRISTNMSQAPSHSLTSPSLENITTTLDSLQAPSQTSTTTTPIAPQQQPIIVPAPHIKRPQPAARPKTYLIIGASRGIGLEFTRQLLEQQHQVISVVRDPSTASQLWQVTGNLMSRPGSCIIEQCDVSSSSDIDRFILRMRLFIERGGCIDTVILNAGILDYEKGLGALDVSFEQLERHLRVNCIGNIVLAKNLLALNELPAVQDRRRQELLTPYASLSDTIVVGRHMIFMSSDSGSMADFREYEDGFAAYGASKVALNMMIRHLAAELKRKGEKKNQEGKPGWQQSSRSSTKQWEQEICVLAVHPGEVSTDMANIELGWEVEGIITAEQSVQDMLRVIDNKGPRHSGTFWRWDGKQHAW